MSKAPTAPEDAELSRCGGPALETKVEASQEAKPETESPEGHIMNEIALMQLRTAELIRQADHERLVREAVRSRRAARREAARKEAESDSHSRRPRRLRFLRAA